MLLLWVKLKLISALSVKRVFEHACLSIFNPPRILHRRCFLLTSCPLNLQNSHGCMNKWNYNFFYCPKKSTDLLLQAKQAVKTKAREAQKNSRFKRFSFYCFICPRRYWDWPQEARYGTTADNQSIHFFAIKMKSYTSAQILGTSVFRICDEEEDPLKPTDHSTGFILILSRYLNVNQI